MNKAFISSRGSKFWPLSAKLCVLRHEMNAGVLGLYSSNGMSSTSVGEWSLRRKCSESAVGLMVGLTRSSLFVKRPFSLHLPSCMPLLFVATSTVYNVNESFRVAVNVITNGSGLFIRRKRVVSKSVSDVVASYTVIGFRIWRISWEGWFVWEYVIRCNIYVAKVVKTSKSNQEM